MKPARIHSDGIGGYHQAAGDVDEVDAAAMEQLETVNLRDTVLAGRGDITEFSPFRLVRVRPPDLIIGDVTPDLLRTFFEQTIVLGTCLFRVRDVDVTAEGIILIDRQFNLCNEIGIDPDYPARWHRDLPAQLPKMQRRRIDAQVVLLAGMGHLGYGHWLVDFLPKLYLLHLGGYRLERLRFLLPSDTPAFARTWLALLGIDDQQLLFYDRQQEIITCRNLLVPSILRFVNQVSPLFRDARAFLVNRLDHGRWRWHRADRTKRKIFVARSENKASFNHRRLIERGVLEKKARAYGFEFVKPEMLQVHEQISLFRSGSLLAGEYSSALHASLFANPGAAVLSVRHNDPALGFLQSSIDHAVGNDSGYVIGGVCAADGSFSVLERDIDFAFDWLGSERRE